MLRPISYLFLLILSTSDIFCVFEEANEFLRNICKENFGRNMSLADKDHNDLYDFIKTVVGLGKFELSNPPENNLPFSQNVEDDIYTSNSYITGMGLAFGYAYSKTGAKADTFLEELFKGVEKPKYLKAADFNEHMDVFKDYIALGFKIQQSSINDKLISENTLFGALKRYQVLQFGTSELVNDLIVWLKGSNTSLYKQRVSVIKNLNMWNLGFVSGTKDNVKAISNSIQDETAIKKAKNSSGRLDLISNIKVGYKLKNKDDRKLAEPDPTKLSKAADLTNTLKNALGKRSDLYFGDGEDEFEDSNFDDFEDFGQTYQTITSVNDGKDYESGDDGLEPKFDKDAFIAKKKFGQIAIKDKLKEFKCSDYLKELICATADITCKSFLKIGSNNTYNAHDIEKIRCHSDHVKILQEKGIVRILLQDLKENAQMNKDKVYVAPSKSIFVPAKFDDQLADDVAKIYDLGQGYFRVLARNKNGRIFRNLREVVRKNQNPLIMLEYVEPQKNAPEKYIPIVQLNPNEFEDYLQDDCFYVS